MLLLLRLLRLHPLLLLLLGLSIPSKCIEAKRTLNRSSKLKHLRSWILRQRRGHHRPAEAPDRYIQLSPRSIRVHCTEHQQRRKKAEVRLARTTPQSEVLSILLEISDTSFPSFPHGCPHALFKQKEVLISRRF